MRHAIVLHSGMRTICFHDSMRSGMMDSCAARFRM